MAGDEGAVHDLTEARPDRWLDEVLEKSGDYDQVAQIIGRNTLGLALVAGFRISRLAVDPRILELTVIEYSLADSPDPQQATLSDFRRKIAGHLRVPLQEKPLPSEPSTEQLQAHIGGRYLLAAALFEVKPVALQPGELQSDVAIEVDGARHLLALDEFREIIDERIGIELRQLESEPADPFDLGVVERAAEAHARGEWQRTIDTLLPLLTPVTLLLRTGEAAVLSQQVHDTVSRGIELLGEAYAESGELSTASEVLRLGVQWVGDSKKAPDLFLRLGDACMRAGSPGEAIGLLRRALKLGADAKLVLPALAQCLQQREQYLAALVCLDRASDAGSAAEALTTVREAVLEQLGEEWEAYQRWFHDSGSPS